MELRQGKIRSIVVTLVAALAFSSQASAQTVTVNRCAAAKVRCVMGYTHVCGVAGVLGLFKCHQKATTKSRFVDQVCINRTLDEITDCFRDAERRNICLTTGDVVAVQSKIEAFVFDAVEDVTPGFPYPITNLCAAGKQKSIAEATAAKLECFDEAFRRDPGIVDPVCFEKPETQLAYSWAKLEGNGGCLTEGDDAAIEAKINAFVADIIVAIDPRPVLPAAASAARVASHGRWPRGRTGSR